MNRNTMWLIDWADRMFKKWGYPAKDYDWCRKLAYYVGEAGNDSPSDYAIKIARQWEAEKPLGNNGEEIVEYNEDDPREDR